MYIKLIQIVFDNINCYIDIKPDLNCLLCKFIRGGKDFFFLIQNILIYNYTVLISQKCFN